MTDPLPVMLVTDTAEQLTEKLAGGLVGKPLAELQSRLTDMGARRIGIDIDRREASPVSAIFGLSRGFLRNDMRVRVYMALDSGEVLGEVEAIEIYAK